MDYYKILNVSYDASLKEIETAYNDLSSFYNPVHNYSKVAYEKYREINKAYEVLKDIKQREMYNLSLHDTSKKEENTINDYKRIKFEDFSFNLDKKVTSKSDLLVRKVKVPYLYYLTKSLYEVTYSSGVASYLNEKCSCCLGEGSVKYRGMNITCPECYGEGRAKKSEGKEINHCVLIIDNDYVIKDNILFIFDFYDYKNYRVNGRDIEILNIEDEYVLNNGENRLIINSGGGYEFNGYSIYASKSVYKEAMAITNHDFIYLNLDDYSFRYESDEKHTYKLELNEESIILQDYNLLIHVIKKENNEYLALLFDYEVVMVNEKLFTKGGYINNHYVKGKNFYLEDKNLYLPSLAYKSKLKDYLWFRIVSMIVYPLIPLTLFLILGITPLFFILSIVLMLVYCAIINAMLEVKG